MRADVAGIFLKKTSKIKDMKRRISFFHFFRSVIFVTALLISISLLSFFLVSFTYYNHKDRPISYDDTVEVYHREDLNSFHSYVKENNLFVLISLKEKKSESFLLDYAYYYFNLYHYPVYLEADNVDRILYVNISSDGISTLD